MKRLKFFGKNGYAKYAITEFVYLLRSGKQRSMKNDLKIIHEAVSNLKNILKEEIANTGLDVTTFVQENNTNTSTTRMANIVIRNGKLIKNRYGKSYKDS